MIRIVRSILLALIAIAASPAAAQSVVILEVADGKYIGMVTTATGQQFAVTNITVKKLTVKPTDPPPPDPAKPLKRVTYVYEKDNNHVPREVSAALHRINAEFKDAIASEFEEDTVDGTGQVPDQYQFALQEARKVGLPALVVEWTNNYFRAVKNPTTEASVMEALKFQ